MSIIQITDLHIPNIGEDTHGIDVRKNFSTLISHINTQEFEYLIITGDIAFRSGSREIYTFVKDCITSINKPIYCIPGNHDERELLKKFFPSHIPGKNCYYTVEIDNKTSIFLDTADASIDKEQLLWLKKTLATVEQAYIFMHHPPVKTGIVYMDNNHAFNYSKELIDMLQSHPYPVHIFCGHYHSSQEYTEGNIHIHICPSAYFQVHPTHTHFSVGSTNFGYNMISLTPHVTTKTMWML